MQISGRSDFLCIFLKEMDFMNNSKIFINFCFKSILFFIECPDGVVEEEASFRVFVTVNARSYVSWSGNLQSRKIELNWTPPSDGIQDSDQIRLYRRHPDQGKNV